MNGFSTLIFLSSGLFLGWNMGASSAAGILGSAVGSKMLTFRRAAWVAAIFVVIGSVAGGLGGSLTLGRLGAVESMPAAFAVALAAALTLLVFTRSGLPMSASQAVVGAIIGWNIYSSELIDWSVLLSIVFSWAASPVLAGILSFVMYFLMRALIRSMRLHLFYWDILLRGSLMVAGAYAAFSLGANNIANVMGVFIPLAPIDHIGFAFFELGAAQALFLIGGMAIATGILTYSHRVIKTIGSDITHLSPENALVVILSISTVLLLFTSTWLPQVPVSSSQATVGAVIGIGIARGAKQIQYAILGKIALGWILTPVAAAILSFLLLNIVSNLFALEI